jgi:PAS domain S-box-containing protein
MELHIPLAKDIIYDKINLKKEVCFMSELFGKEDKKAKIKEIIRKLHQGADVGNLKEEFKELLSSVSSEEIAKIEEELIGEGFSREEIQKLCDLHLDLFRETLEKEEVIAPPGHPINILMEEHKMLLRFAGMLGEIALGKLEMGKFEDVIGHLKEAEKHLLREENALFPYLERHGITQPPAIMWMEHSKIREIERTIFALKPGKKDFLSKLSKFASELLDFLSNHIYKENHILFPTALKMIEEREWREMRNDFDEIGYCCFTPTSSTVELPTPDSTPILPKKEGIERIPFETGELLPEELEAFLDTLPFDITFVDKDDIVRYYNQTKERLFLRTRAIIGRKVQQCHPQKSLHLVNQILDEFKQGTRDVAEFWLTKDGRTIHIRYFAVRDKERRYLGCVEVAQDITDLKKIEGEKRLL